MASEMCDQWPSGESGGQDIGLYYEQHLHGFTSNRFQTLRQLADIQSIDRVVNVYGIVDSVTSFPNRKVTIVDPTVNSSGITFSINNINANIEVKNTIRLTKVLVTNDFNGHHFEVNDRKDFAQFSTFSYDYESESEDNSDVFGKQDVVLQSDKSVAKLLEEWFAHTFLANNSFETLWPPLPSDANQSPTSYVDFACLVVGTQLMKQSIQLTVSDGSQPYITTENQYRRDFCEGSDAPYNQYHRFNTSAVFDYSLDSNRFVFVNVWRNQSNLNNDHFETAERTTLMNGDDLLILFNVDISKSKVGQNSYALNLRSGRHRGKGIRKVNRKSVLGRLLMANISGHQRPLPLPNNQINESHSDMDLMNDSIDCPLMTELLGLGNRKLQALYSQRIKEKEFLNSFLKNNEVINDCDLELMERVLQMRRQLSKFPKTLLSLESYNLSELSITGLELVENWDQPVLIRAKIIECIPKSVFPSNQFILLKCSSCNYTETFKNYQKLVSEVSDIPLDSNQVMDCPNCREFENNSKLNYFYFIIFLIQDPNGETTRVCLTKGNAFNVFGVKGKQLLDDPSAAQRVDDILFEISRLSDEDNGIDWIIKGLVSDPSLPIQQRVYELLCLSKLNTFPINDN